MPEKKQRYCPKCNRTKKEDDFYTSKDLEKYPDGRLNMCKSCITMHVDNWDPNTYLWILQECDIPYVPEEWDKLLASYAKDPTTVTGMTIMGRYISKMKLKQYKDYHWKDTQILQQIKNKKIKEAMQDQGYEAGDIALALEKAALPVETDENNDIVVPPPPKIEDAPTTPFNAPPPPQEIPDYFDQVYDGPEDTTIIDSLTDEDKLYLRMKWGKTYKPDEWVQLEKLYNEMMETYDIQTAGHIDTLKLVCKTSLKSNQLLDMGDVEGAQKMVRMYDMLMKSGHFTANQNKSENLEAIDSVSELVALCEKDGFIPRYYVDGPQDKVDRTLQDLQGYTRSLVTEEMNLGTLIEQAVKQIQDDKEKEAQRDADAAGDEESFEADLFDEDNNALIMNDEDYQGFKDLVEEDADEDDEYFNSLLNNTEMI